MSGLLTLHACEFYHLFVFWVEICSIETETKKWENFYFSFFSILVAQIARKFYSASEFYDMKKSDFIWNNFQGTMIQQRNALSFATTKKWIVSASAPTTQPARRTARSKELRASTFVPVPTGVNKLGLNEVFD